MHAYKHSWKYTELHIVLLFQQFYIMDTRYYNIMQKCQMKMTLTVSYPYDTV